LANSILRTARERRKRKTEAFAAGASSPLRVLPSALALVCCVADYPRSPRAALKKNAAPATQATLTANGAVSHDPKARENSSRSASRDHRALDWVIFGLFPYVSKRGNKMFLKPQSGNCPRRDFAQRRNPEEAP